MSVRFRGLRTATRDFERGYIAGIGVPHVRVSVFVCRFSRHAEQREKGGNMTLRRGLGQGRFPGAIQHHGTRPAEALIMRVAFGDTMGSLVANFCREKPTSVGRAQGCQPEQPIAGGGPPKQPPYSLQVRLLAALCPNLRLSLS